MRLWRVVMREGGCWVGLAGDEELARSALVGRLAHVAICRLLRAAPEDVACFAQGGLVDGEWDRLLIRRFGVEGLAHRQLISSTALSYLRYLRPPPLWRFAGSERGLLSGRVDLGWTDPEGRVLLDEIKTGPWGVDLAGTRAQARRYASEAAVLFGAAFVGVRVLSTAAPARSWLCRVGEPPCPLGLTPYAGEQLTGLPLPPPAEPLRRPLRAGEPRPPPRC